MAAVLAVLLTSLERRKLFERENCLMGEVCFGRNLLKNPTRYIFFLLLQLTEKKKKKGIYFQSQ